MCAGDYEEGGVCGGNWSNVTLLVIRSLLRVSNQKQETNNK